MSFLLKRKKEDLLELGLQATVDMTKPMLKHLITKNAGYDQEDTKLMYEGIVEERKERELLEERIRRDNLEVLMIADQMKKRAPVEFKERHLDEWPSINCPGELAEKFEEFEDVRRTLKQKR
ncbi:hypothetical protein TNCV_2503221 [Trichonephila clavipes]|nr:hypothetical protein TNCV_2503221 [Trichonephila clavipes]